MRIIRLLAMSVVVALLSACSLLPESDPILVENPVLRVYLTHSADDFERDEIEEALRALPGVTEVTFLTSQQTYDQLKEGLKGRPMPEYIDPENMPQVFEVRTTDVDAYTALRDGTARAQAEALPGVDEFVFQCLTEAECLERAAETTEPI
ncbi:permease-like cell division protein FtsX [Catenuloplanes sp. NPDC020197]